MSRQFDAIAIGSGLGGLTAAALFARAGNKVLVLERNHGFGGAATVYRHGQLAIEASLHEIDVSMPPIPRGRSCARSASITSSNSSTSATCTRSEARCFRNLS
jgi:2-polyprenyl-6-methoxyphenol hydroxylase-like FAD-dependent oxidoreductase